MALIKCTECGKEMSDKATACPNCGCPIAEIVAKTEDNIKIEAQRAKLQSNKLNEEKVFLEKENSAKERQIKHMLALLATLIIVCVIGFFLINLQNNTQDNETGTIRGTSDINIKTTALSADADTEAEIEQDRIKRVEKMAENATKEARRINQIKYEINEIRKQLRRKVDSVENVTWLHSKLTPQYISGNVLYCYVGEQSNTAWLRVIYGFSQDDWVFMDKIIFNIDGSIREILVPYSDRKTDIGNGIVEWVDRLVEPTDIGFLQSIANSKKTLVKFSGDTKQRSFTVSQNQKNALKQILRYYLLKEEI